MLLVTMIGGAGTVYGPLIGAVLLAGVGDITRLVSDVQGMSLALYGALLVMIICVLPDGLVALFRRWRMPAAGRKA
jgi:branched-chain amino acid transport system permease protein